MKTGSAFAAGLLIAMLFGFNSTPAKIPAPSPCDQSGSIEGRKWVMKEIRYLEGNTPMYFNSIDRSDNTISFDNDYYYFAPDGTGTYHQGDGVEYELKWKYAADRKDAIEFILSKFRNNRDRTVYWENLDIHNNSIRYTEYYHHPDGRNVLASGIRLSDEKQCGENTDVVTGN